MDKILIPEEKLTCLIYDKQTRATINLYSYLLV